MAQSNPQNSGRYFDRSNNGTLQHVPTAIDRAIMTALLRGMEQDLGLAGIYYDRERLVDETFQKFTYEWTGDVFRLVPRR